MTVETPESVRVLLVDDDRDDYELVLDLLAHSSTGRRYRVDWASTFADALTALAREPYDICLLDYLLGAHDGLELLAQDNRLGTRVPIVVLTGSGSLGVEQRALASGAADYLVKGEIDTDALERSIRHVLERARSAQKLWEREHQFRAVFEAALDAMLIANDQGCYVDANDAALSLIGVTRDRMLTMTVGDLVPPEELDESLRAWATFLRDGKREGEVRLRRADGSDRIVEFRATAQVTPGRHLSVMRDVTDRRLAEGQRLRLAAMVESAADAIEGLTLDGVIDYWSPAAERTYGYSAAEALGQPKRFVVPDDRVPELEEMLTRVRRGECIRDHETLRRRKDGSTFEASVTLSPVLQSGQIVATSVITRDIAEKKRLEAHLAVTERMASVGTLAAGVAHEINNPLAAVIGSLDLLAQSLSAAASGAEVPRHPGRRSHASRSLASQETTVAPSHVVALYDSQHALCKVVVDYLEAGLAADEPLLLIATRRHRDLFVDALRERGVDIDDLYRTSRLTVLDAQETLSSLMVDGAPSAELVSTRMGDELLRIKNQTGAARLRVYGEMVDLLSRDGESEKAVQLEEVWNHLGRVHAFSLLCAYDEKSLHGPAQVRQVCACHSDVLVADGRLERPALPVASLANTRELAIEIAEQLAASRLASAVSARPPWVTELSEPLADARSAADRIRHIVRDLKLFSKPDEEQSGPVDLRRVIDSASRMAWNEIRHRARLVKDYGEAPPVQGSDARLGQVFLNLIVNAAQAIREGDAGRNEIRIVTRTLDDGRVVAEVRDTGDGIAPEALERLFEPFFSTKPVGVGTGLGLSICRRIVDAHGGTISATSTPGLGTTFRVVLPAAHPQQELLPTRAVRTSRPVQRGRVLVIDDEPIIVRLVRRVLDANHTVTAVTGGAAALELLRSDAHFDVIICDMMMPQMSGKDFYEALSRTSPELASRIVFLTGGAFTSEAREFLDRIPNQRVEKPFDAIHLRGVVDDRVSAVNVEDAS